MNVKELLKTDQGIDVLISSGNGRRDSPFVVERCSAPEAALTQLNLLRGTGHGLGEMWRIKEWEASHDGIATEVIHVESIRFTEDTIEEINRAVYFDTRDVSGSPHSLHPLTCWQSPDNLWALPFELGWVHFSGITDNRDSSYDYDQVVSYSGIECNVTVYVYSRPQGHDIPIIRDFEMANVISVITQRFPDLEDPWEQIEVGPFLIKYFVIGDKITGAAVAVCGDYFVKLRMTFHDDLRMRKMMKDTVDALVFSVETAMGEC